MYAFYLLYADTATTMTTSVIVQQTVLFLKLFVYISMWFLLSVLRGTRWHKIY